MGFLKRFVGRDPPPPEWASFFTASEYKAFLATLTADLRRRNLSFELGDGMVLVQLGENDQTLGMINIAQKCHMTSTDAWPTIVAEHFTALFSMIGRDLDALAADFDQVREILRVRLYADESMGGISPDPDGAVLRPIAPGIQMGLVYDFPDSVASVLESHLARWPLDEGELLAVALTNTLSEPPPNHESMTGRGESTFDFYYGDSFYVASRALGLRDDLPDNNVHGAVIGVPNRHSLIVHSITDLDVVLAISAMIPMVQEFYRDGPGSISNQLYWWRDGELIHLPVGPGPKGFTFMPPDAFVELLNSLPPALTTGS